MYVHVNHGLIELKLMYLYPLGALVHCKGLIDINFWICVYTVIATKANGLYNINLTFLIYNMHIYSNNALQWSHVRHMIITRTYRHQI